MALMPDLFELDVYNFPNRDLNTLRNAKVIAVCGDGMSSLCEGKLEEIYTHIDSGKSITTILISDGMDFWKSSISLSIAGGNSVESTIRKIVASCTNPAKIVSYIAQDMRLIRGQVFHGRAADYVSTLAKSVGARAFMVRNGISIVRRGAYSMSVNLSEDDMPDGVSEANGAFIVRLRDIVAYPVGQMAIIENRRAQYRIICQSFECDTQQGAWTTSLILVDEEHMLETDGNEWGGG